MESLMSTWQRFKQAVLGSTSIPTSIKVNCWFCNEDTTVETASQGSWTCPSCHQYNGFDEDGDYDQVIPEQHDVKEYKTSTVCSAGEFDAPTSLLCHTCNQNQVLKVRQLATFIPFDEINYDSEVDMYKDYLENVYNLCLLCGQRVAEYLQAQDDELKREWRDNSHQPKGQHSNTKRSAHHKRQNHHLSKWRQWKFKLVTLFHRGTKLLNGKISITTALFAVCLLFAVLHGLSTCRLYAASSTFSGGSGRMRNLTRLQIYARWLVSTVQAESAIFMQSVAVYCGLAVCSAALIVCGKNRLYPEDVLHLMLWLLTFGLTSDLFASSLPWLSAHPEVTVIASIFTLIVSALACARNRTPRNFMNITIKRKDLSPKQNSNEEISYEEKRCNQRENNESKSRGKTAAPVTTTTTPDASSVPNGPSPLFEDVRTFFESFSLGLSKKSGSSSSVWSMPAVVTSSPSPSPTQQSFQEQNPDVGSSMVPDSTTQLRPSSPTQSRFISPSRLGYVNFGSLQRDQQGPSRSPSPWDFVRTPSPSFSFSDTSGPLISQGTYHCVPSIAVPNVSSGYKKPKGPCDSQTPMGNEFHHIQRLGDHHHLHHGQDRPSCYGDGPNITKPKGPENAPSVRDERHSLLDLTRKKNTQMSQKNTSKVVPKNGVISDQHAQMQSSFSGFKKPPRRSQRIAGKSPKPWGLRKSFSCNDAYDNSRSEPAGGSLRRTKMEINSNAHQAAAPLHSMSHQADFMSASSSGRTSQTHRGDFQKNIQSSASNDLHSHKHSVPSLSTGTKNRRKLYAMLQNNSDLSDVEEEFFHGIGFDSSRRNAAGRIVTAAQHSDFSWKWILIGSLIGTSVTANVFLALHSWMLNSQKL